MTVPVLTYAAGMDPKSAIATSLLVVGVTSLAALVPHARHRLVCWRTGIVFGGTGMLGAYAGGRLAKFVPGGWLLVGFAAMMIATAIAMLRSGAGPAKTATLAASKPEGAQLRLVKVISHGLAVGAVTGLVGAGGGFLIVPALMLLGGMPIQKAVATSLLVVAMKSLAGFAGHAGHLQIDWGIVVPVATLAVVGSMMGSVFSKKVPHEVLRRGFAWFVLAMAAFVLAMELPVSVRASAGYQAVFVERWPWWVGGAAIGAIVLGLVFVDNKQLGVSTGCSELCAIGREPRLRGSWRLRFLLGIVLGGTTASLFAAKMPTLAMGSLDTMTSGNQLAKLVLLLGAGTLVGFGSRLAGGCTSGHGIVGTALGARSSWVATALFMIAGFATTHLLSILRGG